MALHVAVAERARKAGAAMVVFPQLSLGRDGEALTLDDPRLAILARASHGIDIVAGLLEGAVGGHHVAQACWSGGRVVHVQRQAYPDHLVSTDRSTVVPGDRLDAFPSRIGTVGLAIGQDLDHASVPYVHAIQGAFVVIAPASAGAVGSGPDAHLLARFYAQYLTLYVARVVPDGRSHVVAPDGTMEAEATVAGNDLLIAEIDPELVARERHRNPLMRDERIDVVYRLLHGRAGPPPNARI